MIIDRTHIKWGVVTALASAGVGVLYLANCDPVTLKKWHLDIPLPAWVGPVPPLRENFGATPLGLIYGTIALLIFFFAALLGWRRSHQTAPVGRIQTWLRAHIWLTIFTIPLVVFHSGFHWGGAMTQALVGLYAFVMLSGFWGLALQNIVPRLMRNYLPEEVVFEQIPYIRSQLVSQAEAIRVELAEHSDEPGHVTLHGEGRAATLAASHAAAVKTAVHFIDTDALPYLRSPRRTNMALRDKDTSDNQFRLMKLQVAEFIQPSLENLQSLCDEKRRLDLQTRLHYWLHGWLIVHAPASLLLIVLTVVHAIVAAFLYA